ncbi:MAG: hypothetical protein JOS17DRAFT_447963 [Linnemannia elongata]|nr:MAG: hypothetical protein JOS17DRAFT_447963 [Linnemannia elongata]
MKNTNTHTRHDSFCAYPSILTPLCYSPFLSPLLLLSPLARLFVFSVYFCPMAQPQIIISCGITSLDQPLCGYAPLAPSIHCILYLFGGPFVLILFLPSFSLSQVTKRWEKKELGRGRKKRKDQTKIKKKKLQEPHNTNQRSRKQNERCMVLLLLHVVIVVVVVVVLAFFFFAPPQSLTHDHVQFMFICCLFLGVC